MERKETLDVAELAAFMRRHHEELLEVCDSGYGLSWFPNCLYRFWNRWNKIDGLKLWGNMGQHYSSQIGWQFSEVMVGPKNDYESAVRWQKDIFVLALVGKESRIRGEFSEIRKRMKNSNVPYSFILIRFDSLETTRTDPLEVNADNLFSEVNWMPSFEAKVFSKLKRVSIGLYE